MECEFAQLTSPVVQSLTVDQRISLADKRVCRKNSFVLAALRRVTLPPEDVSKHRLGKGDQKKKKKKPQFVISCILYHTLISAIKKMSLSFNTKDLEGIR